MPIASGKTFVGAYFVGVKGTVHQTLALGLVVATTHTIGVLAIDLVTPWARNTSLPEKPLSEPRLRAYDPRSRGAGSLSFWLLFRWTAAGSGCC
ncbi:MAG TPA: hypothetical protein VJL07_00965 [Dehalococcoidia bacterium]|nr:hypothetical protein [Dehalococcoidia bacterium]